jgi:hypothetical protein
MERVSLPNQLLIDVLNYLASKPWAESHVLIAKIDEELRNAKLIAEAEAKERGEAKNLF